MAKKKLDNEAGRMESFPLLVLDDVVVLPALPQPVKIEDDERNEFINKAFSEHREIIAAWMDYSDDQKGQLRRYSTLCHVDKVLQMPGAPTLAFLVPHSRASIIQVENESNSQLKEALAHILPEVHPPSRKLKETKLLEDRLLYLFDQMLNYMPDPERKNAEMMVKDFSNNSVLRIYALSHVAPVNLDERYQILACNEFATLLHTAVLVFDQALQRLNIQSAIQERTHRELSQQQKEAFLRLHLRQIREELGEGEEDKDLIELVSKSEKKIWSREAAEHFTKELDKLKRLNTNNPEYSVQYSYLEALLSLPWENYSHKNISLKKVEQVLNRDHFGLEKVKDRVIEHMAVLKLRNDLKAPIICLYGPPGVGKTSIGKSVAEALGREYVRISLGGMHDEAEIRGHRRTYIGAMPGRFLQSLSKCTTGNPLILLDEIDKVGKDYKGDPSSALLEALDPEQNNTFHDNFIDFPYDLSKVIFIATANDLSTIPAPLRDRMEIIEMTGYIPEEKKEIALRHLVKKSLKENGFEENEIKISPDAINEIIRFYTREAGVRQLEKKIGKILRKIARLKASKKSFPTKITRKLVNEYLGKKEVNPDNYEENDFAGVATGLAWTPAGGDILFIETSLSPGKGEKLTLTGNLGDVMKESAVIALQYLKAHATELGINPDLFNRADIHIHVPEGAVPKDGPSAGITLATSMVSAFTGRKLHERTAMTGEITLRGKVLPVGGVKEKIIAARGAGIKRIILSKENRKDIEEIAPQYIEGLEFFYVDTLQDVFRNILLEEKALHRFTFLETSVLNP